MRPREHHHARMLPQWSCAAEFSQRPPKTLSTQRPPPHSSNSGDLTAVPSNLVLSDRSPVRPLEPSASTHSPGVPRPPAKPGVEPGRTTLPQHPRVTHPTARTRAPSPCSHLARHPPHRVLRLCTTPPLLRSSTSPPQHCTPRQACVRKHTHKRSQRAVSLCAFF